MRNDRRRDFEKEVPEFKERLVFINRVAKVVKGGKNYRFTALMVVGNENGKVGVGLGLPLSRTMANRLGGTVRLDTSYAGPGARFEVEIPIHP